jgi:hypothetical protein
MTAYFFNIDVVGSCNLKYPFYLVNNSLNLVSLFNLSLVESCLLEFVS